MKKLNQNVTAGLIAAVLLAILGGCAGLGDLIRTPTARVESVDITGLSFSGVSLQVNLSVDNPNPVGISLSAYDYGLSVAGTPVVEGRQEDTVALRASGTSLIPIPLDLTFGNLAAAGSALVQKDSVPVDIGLGLEIAMPYMGGVRLDLTGGVEIPVIKPPLIRPAGIRVESINLSGAWILVSLDVRNPNGYAAAVKTADGLISVAGREWGRISVEDSGWIAAGKSAPLTVRMRLDFAEAGRSAWSLLTGSAQADVRVDGTMDIDMDLPAFSGGGVKWDADAKVSIIR